MPETNSFEICPKCKVSRGPLPTGGWCPTCGYNPKHVAEVAVLETRIAEIDLYGAWEAGYKAGYQDSYDGHVEGYAGPAHENPYKKVQP